MLEGLRVGRKIEVESLEEMCSQSSRTAVTLEIGMWG